MTGTRPRDEFLTDPAAAPENQAAPRLDDYEVLELIGRGGMASVYLARQIPLDRLVALKELALIHASDPRIAARFLHESRVAGRVSHPHVVTVYDYFEHRGIPYIGMEHLPRGSLRPLVGQLSLPQVIGVLVDVLAGLAAAAGHRIVHRDLKPENILVTLDGRVKIADFGIATAIGAVQDDKSLPDDQGTVVGTPAYMAPEQAAGGKIGPQTDLYSVGLIAYELLTGSLPFSMDGGPTAVLRRHRWAAPAPLRDRLPDADPRLATWVDRLLAKRPDRRPDDAREVREALEDLAVEVLGPHWRRNALLGEPRGESTPPGDGAAEPSLRLTIQPPVAAAPLRSRLGRAAIATVAILVTAGGVLAMRLGDSKPAGTDRAPQATPVTRQALEAGRLLAAELSRLRPGRSPQRAVVVLKRAQAAAIRADGELARFVADGKAERDWAALAREAMAAEQSYVVAVEALLRGRPTRARLKAAQAHARVFAGRLDAVAEPATAAALRSGTAVLRRWALARAPVRLSVPATIHATARGDHVLVRFRARASRAGSRLRVRCRPRSGSDFPLGATRVRCAAAGRSESFTVLVSRPPAAPAGSQVLPPPSEQSAPAPDPPPIGAVDQD